MRWTPRFPVRVCFLSQLRVCVYVRVCTCVCVCVYVCACVFFHVSVYACALDTATPYPRAVSRHRSAPERPKSAPERPTAPENDPNELPTGPGKGSESPRGRPKSAFEDDTAKIYVFNPPKWSQETPKRPPKDPQKSPRRCQKSVKKSVRRGNLETLKNDDPLNENA